MTLRFTGLSAVRAGRTVLHRTDLAIAPGERIGLVGASGSGKSTLGHELCDRSRADGVAVAHVPQSPDEALDPLRTLAFHWSEAERGLGLAPDPARRARLLAAMDLDGADLGARPWAWSRGMQQRFAIALALIGRPRLLIADEPTSALDPLAAARAMDLMDRCLAGSETALLLITHDLALAARRVTRLVILSRGRVVEDGATADVLDAPRSSEGRALVANRRWTARRDAIAPGRAVAAAC